MKKITEKQENISARLYRKKLSAREIATKLGLSLSQVYDALERKLVNRRTSVEQNKIRFLKSPLSFKYPSKPSKKQQLLITAALMLYRGEGAKTGTTVDLANSDPGTLKVFLSFLRKVCKIKEKRLKLYLYCFSKQDINQLIGFWSKFLKVKESNFTKPYVRKTRTTLTRTMRHGVLHIRYSDKRLLEKILASSEELIQRLSK